MKAIDLYTLEQWEIFFMRVINNSSSPAADKDMAAEALLEVRDMMRERDRK